MYHLNAFKYCGNSEIPEAKLAFNMWTLDLAEAVIYAKEKQLGMDLELLEVYAEWLDEYCDNDLRKYR